MTHPDARDPGALLSREANALCGLMQFARERQYPETVLRQVRTLLDQRLLALAAQARADQRRAEAARTSSAA